MNRGKGQVQSRQGGYTIVETLIFLAVSSALFISAMILIGGQQNKAQFVNAVRDLETRLTDISNDIATGYYQNSATFSCSVSGTGTPYFPSGGVSNQGENKDCMFVGTVIKFGQKASGDTLAQFSMAGRRVYTDATGEHTVSDLGTAKPQAVFYDNSGGIIANAAPDNDLLYGASISCVGVGSSCVPGANQPAAIGFFASLVPESGQGGSVGTDIYYYPTVTKLMGKPITANTISQGAIAGSVHYANPITWVNKNPAAGITICLKSGGTNQYALLHLSGTSTTKLVVTSEIKAGSSCS